MLKFMMAATALIALSVVPALAGGPGHMPSFNATAAGGGHVTTGTNAGGQGSSTIGAHSKAGQLNGSIATAQGNAGGGASLKGVGGGGNVQTSTASVAGGFSVGNGSEQNSTSGNAWGSAGGGGSLNAGFGKLGMPAD